MEVITRRTFISSTAATAALGPLAHLAAAMDPAQQPAPREKYDVIVVGLGAIGSAAAYHLAKRNASVLGLEQFDLAHTLGSSGGLSRQTKLAVYLDGPWEPLIRRTFELWPIVEKESQQQVLHLTGGLFMNRRGRRWPEPRDNSRHEILDHQQLADRFGQFELPANYAGLYYPIAGVLRPERSIAAHCTVALRHGAELHAREPVLKYEATDAGVTVTTSRRRYRADRVVFCAGAWTNKLLADLGHQIQVTRQQMSWFWPKQPELFRLGKLPTWMLDNYYGFPMLPDYPGFKLALHGRGAVADPTTIDRQPTAADEQEGRDCLRRFIPQADGQLLKTKICMYQWGGPFIGLHPEQSRVLLGVGDVGAFKFSCVLGEILADLVLAGRSNLPVDFLNPHSTVNG